MSTVEVEVLRREAVRKEKNEIEQIREKYRKQRKQGKYTRIVDLERQAIMQEAQIQETKEKEKSDKYKKEKKQVNLNQNLHTTGRRSCQYTGSTNTRSLRKKKMQQNIGTVSNFKKIPTTNFPEKIDSSLTPVKNEV